MDYNITREFLDKARKRINEHPPYPEDDPILDMYDGHTDVERRRSTDLVKMLTELGYDPYDMNDYGDLTE